MEPEDLPWPSELEEEDDDEEGVEGAEEAENSEDSEDSGDSGVMGKDVEEEEGRELDADLNYESRARESTDDEEDEEATAWLQAHPGGMLSLPKHRYSEGERTGPEKAVPLTSHVWQQSSYQDDGRTKISDSDVVSLQNTAQWGSEDDQRTESWHFLPQEIDSSHTSDTTQTRFNVRKEGTEVTNFPSVEEGILTQSENQVKEPNRDLFCSPLLVIQDSFASPDLPLLTCLTQDQELGSDSLFHQSELHFTPLRGIPAKSEDTGSFSRPSEVSEALFQAASEGTSDLEGLQGKAGSDIYKAESDVCTLGDDTECCSLDESAVACIQGSTERQREICDQGDWTDECIELVGLENFLDDLEICDSSLSWQSALQLPSKEESSFEECVGHSNMDINQSFSSVLPPFVPHEPARELEYHSSDLRMLRVSPEIMPRTPKHLSGDISKGDITEIIQSNLKQGIATTSGDSEIGSHLPLSPEDFPQLAVRSSVENTIGLHADTLNQQILADGRVTEETLEVLAVPELADQKTEISTISSSSYSLREKPNIFYPQALKDSYLTEESLRVSAVPQPPDQKTSISAVSPSSYLLGEKHSIFYQQVLPDSHQIEEATKFSAVFGPADQTSEKTAEPSGSYLHREKHIFFSQQQLPDSHLIEQPVKVSFVPVPAEKATVIPPGSSTLYSHEERPHIFYQQTFPESHITEQALKVSVAPGSTDQKKGIPTVSSTSYSHREKPSIFYQQELPESHLTEQTQQVSAVSEFTDQKTRIPTTISTSYSNGEKPHIFYQQTLPVSQLTEQALKVSAALGLADQKSGIPTVTSTSYLQEEKTNVFYQQELPESHLTKEVQKVPAVPGPAQQKTGIPIAPSISSSHRGKTSFFNDQELIDSHLTEQARRISYIPGPAGQNTGTQSVPSSAFSHREKPIIFYQQEFPDSHLIEEALKVSSVLGPAEQNTGIPSGSSGSYSFEEKPSIFYQQLLPDSHLTEQALKVLPVPRPDDQKTDILTVPSGSDSHREKPNIFYQQELPDNNLTEQPQQVSSVPRPAEENTGIPRVPSTFYPHRENPFSFYPQGLPDSHPPEEALKVSAVPGPIDQKTELPSEPSSFYSQREKSSIFYQQELPDSRLTEEALKVSAVPETGDQKPGLPIASPRSYSLGGKSIIFYPQALPDTHLTEEALKVSAVPGPADQNTGLPSEPSSSYSNREKSSIFYQQELPDSCLTDEALKVSAVPGPADQKSGLPSEPSSSYSNREKSIIFYQQELPDSRLTEEALKVSAVPGPGDQKPGLPIASPRSYSLGGKSIIFYPQVLPDTHLTEEALKVSTVPGPADQNTGLQSEPSSSYSQREKSSIFYQQELPDSRLTEEALKVPTISRPADQNTGIPTVPSTSYSHRENHIIFSPQALSDSHVLEEALKVSAVPGPADQKTGLPSEPSSSYSNREKPNIFYQQELPDSRLTEEALKVSAVPETGDQKTGLPIASPRSYSLGGKFIIFYPQALPDTHLTEEALKVSAVPGPADQNTGLPSEPSSSYSNREKSSIFYQQELPDSRLTDEALKVSAVPGPADQKSGLPSEPSSSYSNREKSSIFYQQELPDSRLTEEALKVSAVPGPGDQKPGLPIASPRSYSLGGKSIVFYPQALPDTHLTEEALKVSAVPGPGDQKPGLPIASPRSYSLGGKSIVFYPQALPDTHLTEEALKVSTISRPTDQNTGLATVPSTFYPHRENHIIFSPQALSDSHILEEALKVSAVPGPADQKTGLPSEPSSSYSNREKPIIFYPQGLPDSHLTEEALKVSAVPGPADQNTGLQSEPSSSYSQREKSSIFYPQGLPDSRLTEEALKVSAVPETGDQKPGLPIASPRSYSLGGKSIIFYPQALPDTHLTEEALKVSAVPRPADQNTGLPSEPSSSYSQREKSSIFYQQELPDSRLTDEALKVSAVPGPADQNTGIPSEPSSPYSQREKSNIFYQQELPDSRLTEEALKVSAVPGPADQNTGLQSEPSSSYSQREKSSIFYQQELPDSRLTEEALKVPTISRPADQNTGIPTVPSTSYPHRENHIIFSPQALSDSHVLEEALKVSAVPGPADQKTGLPSEPSSSYSNREKPSIFYPQGLPDSHLTEEALKVSAVPETGDQKTGLPIASPRSYSLGGKSIIFYPQALPDKHFTEEALSVLVSPGPADQKTELPTVSSTSYSQREKPFIFNPQALPESHLTEEPLKVSTVLPGDQNIRIPVVTSASYLNKEMPVIFYQEALADGQLTVEALKVSTVPRLGDQDTRKPTVTSTSYSQREKPITAYQQELPGSHVTEEALKVSVVPGTADRKTGIPTVPSSSYSYREKPIISYQQDIAQDALKVLGISRPADQKTEIPAGPSNSYSHKEKPRTSTVILPDDQKTELPTAPFISYSPGEKPKNLTVIGPDDQKTTLLTVFHNSYSQTVKPNIFVKQHLPDRHHSEDNLNISSVPEPTDVNSGIPVSPSSSHSHKEKPNILYPQELTDIKYQNEDVLKVSTVPEPAGQKTVLPTTPPSIFSHKEKPDIFYQQDLPGRHLTEDALKFSSGFGQADQTTGISTVHRGTYSHSEKHKLISDHIQSLIDNLDSSNSSIISDNTPLNSQVDGRVVINKPEPSGFEAVGSEEFQNNDSKTLKEIRTLLMEAENIALKRCNFPAPLVPFRDVSDISFIQSKKVVCFKEPPTTGESNVDLPQRQPFTEENPSNKCTQKDISTQTNLKCQNGIENWEFISSTTVRSPLQKESKARVALSETLRRYKAAGSVMRSEPEGYNGTLGNKILIPMMTIIKSDSSSDASSCSWDSNSLESVSDVLLNLFPYASPNMSMTNSKEEECMSESDDGGSSSVDSLAAHVKNLLECESSLNHAKQILRNAEEEESRVRARAWNLKFNMAHECGYSISELNEDDRRKVEEIKAKLFDHERTTDLSKGLYSPQGIGCKPEGVCSHIIIESHEKGCFRTLTTQQPQLDNHPCLFRSAEPLEMIRGRRSPSSWRTRHINLSKSLDQSNPHFKVWNSLQLQSHSPLQNLTTDDFNISKGFQMPFREKMDPWLSELVEPTYVPPGEMDCHSSSQMLPPESMKKFTTSITFSSHRHSKCFSDSSVLKVGVTEDSQCTGASVGVFNSHFTEEQSPPRDLKQKTSSPSSFKTISHSPDKAVTILTQSPRQSQKLSVEHSHQREKILEISDFKVSDSEPNISTNCSKFKEVHFSDNHTLSMGRPSSTVGVKEKNLTVTPNPPSHIFIEQQELIEQSRAKHADHYVRKHHSPPPQHQDYIAPKLPCHIFLENRKLFEQSKTPHVDHQVSENHSPLPQGQDYIASDLPSSIFLEQRQLFEQSKAPDIDHHMGKQYSPLSQGQDFVVENNDQQKSKSHISTMIHLETKFNNVVSQSPPNQYTVVTSPSTPPSNRKALSCVRITLSPKIPSKLDSGTLDKSFLSLDPASKTIMNSEFNSDLQTISSRALKPTSKLLTSKPVAHDQESLGFLGPKSSPDFQVIQSLPDSNTKDLKTIPFHNSQIVTSRQTQVNFSDLEEYSNPEGTSVSADRSLEEIKPLISALLGKSSDAVTQITTEGPEKTTFSSEIFINAEDNGREISEPSSRKLGKVPVSFASSSSSQQMIVPLDTDRAQPSLLPYKPSGSTKMYYVPQLSQNPPSLDSKSDTTIESSHSGSNDAIAPDFPAQVLGTRDDDLALTVNIKHKEGIYSKRKVMKASLPVGRKPFHKDAQVQVCIAGNENISDKNQKKEIYNKKTVTKSAQPEETEFLQKDATGSSDAAAAEHSAQLQDTKVENLPGTEEVEQKETTHSQRPFPKEAWSEDKGSLQIDIKESRCHSEFENTTHSVFRSAKFYFHHPVHLPSDQDFCHESLGRSVFMRHSWKDFFQQHPDKQYTSLPSPSQNEEKMKTDYTRIESLSINVNLENKEVIHPTKSQARDYAKCDKQNSGQKRDFKVTPEPTPQHSTSLNELWNKYQERQKQQKTPGFGDRRELSLVERLDRLAKLLQNPITHSLGPSESTQDDRSGQRDAKEWSGRQQQQKNKFQKKKQCKSLEKCHKNIAGLKKSKEHITHQAGRSNQIKIEQVKFDKYILRKQPGFCYINTSSDSRLSEDSDLLTDTATNILSTTTSPVESDILTPPDKEVTLHERSSSVSTIDTARLIKAFGHERVGLSPRRIKLYSSIADHQRRYIEKRNKNKRKALSTGYPLITSEHTRRKRIQVENHMISSDSISSSTSNFWSSSSTLCDKQNAHMLNKGVQAGNLEIVNGVKKHTRDVGVTFPTPSSSKTRVEEDSDVTSWSEEKIAGKIEEKKLLTNYLGDKKLRKNKQSSCEGVSWFVPVENVKSGPKKEKLLKPHGPGISWFAPVTNTKPWREPLREQNRQGQHTDSRGIPAGLGRGQPKPFVRATLQESLQLHRPDFISRSGERIKRLKLIVQERKLQNMLQSEREALFNTGREWQGRQGPAHPLPKRGFLAFQKDRPIGKKEMIQRSKRVYEQLPEVQKKREEEKRRLEYKSYRLRAQLYKKKVTNQLLGRKVPWD
ncbi:centrosome-associated protein ALMS1 isoform X2 [Saccopteryx bilineata]|uniref:centrosome-associated protein ALMS1 isoform X2 n=1 Tax=Saccopteryx bilineata TaxID=59482 RepID=UPI00338DA07C